MNEPAAWLLLRLAVTVGAPFFVVSTTAPLVQNWLARTTAESRRDPYFLYAASNAGSLLSLAVYPLIVEPRLGVAAQSRFWAGGYWLLVVMVLGAALLALKRCDPALDHPTREQRGDEAAFDAAPLRSRVWTRFYWLAAAFVPSALMLAVTSRISIDLASVPFLWIVPLAIYLLTFILAFAKNIERSLRSTARLAWLTPPLLLVLLPLAPQAAPSRGLHNWLLSAGHLAALFVGAYLCHTALAARRPAPRRLTEFYFWIALGGALGGVFAAIVAPQLFRTVLEYPLLIGALPFFRAAVKAGPTWNWKDWALPGLMAVSLFLHELYTAWFPYPLIALVAAAYLMRERPLRFALAFTVLLAAAVWVVPQMAQSATPVAQFRNFFGAKKVSFSAETNLRTLMHGDTIHGYESMDPALAGQPLSYYHRTGPVGDVMRAIEARPPQHVGVVGLGTGSMAAYAGANRRVTFFDVDPQILEISRAYFSFLQRCGDPCDIVLGDGRLSIGRQPDGTFDVLMLDAFNSDSIPPHLVSREAIQIYRAKLKPDGLMLFHVSSRYLNVVKLVAAAVTDAKLPAYIREDNLPEDKYDVPTGKLSSVYIAVGSNAASFGTTPDMAGWQPLAAETELRPWTDDYSNMLGVIPPIEWRKELHEFLPRFF